jgi:SAM-dependent methyltransferase
MARPRSRERGDVSMVARAKRVLSTLLLERRFGLETTEVVELSKLDLADEARNNYIPSSWGTMKRIAQTREITPRDVFVDFGSGKGRMVFLAAQYPFKRVVGIELAADLHHVAQANIARNRERLRCPDVQLVNQDVLSFPIPDDMTFAYFFNPFTGNVFTSVADNIGASLQRNPRRLTIVYTNPVMHEYLIAQPWLVVKHYAAGQVGVYESTFGG